MTKFGSTKLKNVDNLKNEEDPKYNDFTTITVLLSESYTITEEEEERRRNILLQRKGGRKTHKKDLLRHSNTQKNSLAF